MTYHLFIDDERYPADTGQDWVIVRSLNEMRDVVSRRGMPGFISFDHDLGDNVPTGFDIAKALVAADLDAQGDYPASPEARGLSGALPADFAYTIHSQNPIGAANISGLLDPYLAIRST